jgi:hypothetical protein
MRAINVSVYKNESFKGCSVGGVSERFNEILLLHERGNIDVQGDEENLCKIVRREIGSRVVFHIQPMYGADGSFSFGGAYAASCDSRFCELIEGQYGAIAIHDRKEW